MSDLDFARLREVRATRPGAVAQAAAARVRRPLLGPDGRLMLVAADHPGRGSLGVRAVPDAMADRYDLLRRLVTALRRPGVDGVLGTPDILEDLLLLGALDDKVVIGSMNRGGLQGAVFELDDRFTGYDAATVASMGFDGGKMFTRIDPDDPATAATLRVDGRVVNDLSAPAVAKSVGVVSALGVTSAYTWLKLPVVEDMATVMAATTLPALLLGGDPAGHPDETYARWRDALTLPGVRGLVVGRALLYPPDGDVSGAVDAAVSLVRPALAPLGES
ncbi:MAG: deoxyribose-phosphate aldolase [Actinobacteria bacterium 13_1_20CM_3_71_11]|nr:MAG: deoxyribose-phosphate aldolase [Actinobacteria bacterium 13_1_20CM_3_71_11]